MSVKFEIVYDPHAPVQLQLNAPNINPLLIACLCSQIAAAITSQAVGTTSGLIVPATALPKVNA